VELRQLKAFVAVATEPVAASICPPIPLGFHASWIPDQ
jgi:hypothetical protein